LVPISVLHTYIVPMYCAHVQLSDLCYSIGLQKSGMAMVSDVEREKTMVQELMDFKEKLDAVISDSFQKNEKFQRALQV